MTRTAAHRPIVSVVTVTYNSGSTLQRTIDSVRDQGYENLEYIIVDGGSCDDTVEVIQRNLDVVSFWASESDEGISDAFNKGIAMATGDIVGIINSDDMLLPGALQKLADFYSPDIDVYRGKCMFRDESSGFSTVETPSMRIAFDGRTKVDHPSTFISRRAYEKYGLYDVRLRYAMDLDLLFRFQQKGAKFAFVDEPLTCFTMGGVTFNSDRAERRKEMQFIMEKNGVSRFARYRYVLIDILKCFVLHAVGREVILKLRNGKNSVEMS